MRDKKFRINIVILKYFLDMVKALTAQVPTTHQECQRATQHPPGTTAPPQGHTQICTASNNSSMNGKR